MKQYTLLLITLVLALYSCGVEPVEQVPEEEWIIDPSVDIVDDVVRSTIDSLGLNFKIMSPRLLTKRTNAGYTEEYPNGFEVSFFDKKENSQSSISSGYAYISENGIVTLRKKVKIESESGDELVTSFLTWDLNKGKLDTDKLIRLVESSGDTIYGFGLIANSDFSSFTIKNGFAGKRQFQNLRAKLDLDN